MRYLIIIALAVAYWTGALPASWAVSLLFASSFLMREPGRNPRRGGSRRPAASPEPSLTTMFTNEATSTAGGSFSFSTAPGDESAGSGIPLTPPDPSRPGGPSFSGAVTVDHGESGAPRGSVAWSREQAVKNEPWYPGRKLTYPDGAFEYVPPRSAA